MMKEILSNFKKPYKIDWGCGYSKCTDFIGIDVRRLPGVDIVYDNQDFPVKCAKTVHSHHFIEHLTYKDAEAILNKWHKMLIDSGELVIFFPDMEKLVQKKNHLGFSSWVCGRQKNIYDYHRSWWSKYLLEKFMKDHGFTNIKEIEYPQSYHTNIRKPFGLTSGLRGIK